MSTIKLSVIMLITGKISGGSHKCLTMTPYNCVKIGRERTSSPSMKRGAFCKHRAWSVMDGKSKNIILDDIKLRSVKIKSANRTFSAIFIITIMTEEIFTILQRFQWFQEIEKKR